MTAALILDCGSTAVQGLNWVILRGLRRYICYSKDEIIHGLSPSVKCVTTLRQALSQKYEIEDGRAPHRPKLRPCSCYYCYLGGWD